MNPTDNTSDTTLTEFAFLAERYCAFIDERERYILGVFLRRAHVLLARLYVAALLLPAVEVVDEAGNEEDEQEDESDVPQQREPERCMSHEQWWDLFMALRTFIGEKRDYYLTISDPYAEPEREPLYTSLSDDLADVYRDLINGLTRWREGNEESALWEWRFHFTIHWGEHAGSAMRAIHELAYTHDLGFPRPPETDL